MKVRCAICDALASRFFVSLDNNLWATCEKHAYPFEGSTVELNPETCDLDDLFEATYEGASEAAESAV